MSEARHANSEGVPRGSNLAGYRENAAPRDLETQEVLMWRERIDRASALLRFQDRLQDAVEGDRYLDGTKEAKNGHVIYLRHLLPILEDLHSRTLPNIPEPTVEARSEQGELFEDQVREFLRRKFDQAREHDTIATGEMQWDDARMGCFIGKVEWEEAYQEPDGQVEEADALRLDIETEKALVENEDPLAARVTDSDLDDTHIEVHEAGLTELDLYDPAFEALDMHIVEHRAQTMVILRQDASLKRIATVKYVYDPDVPWEDRPWEAELVSMKIRDLQEQGFKNLSPENLPMEHLPAQSGKPAFEDMTARVWFIHDRETGKQLVIPADGPKEGRFLRRRRWAYRDDRGDIDIYKLMSFRPWRSERTEQNRDQIQSWGTATIQQCIPILERLAHVDFNIDRHVKDHASYMSLYPNNVDTSKMKQAFNDPDRKHAGVPIQALAMWKEYAPPPIPSTLLEQRASLFNQLHKAAGLDAQDVGQEHAHQITATESATRGEASQQRKNTRQETMATFLSWVAETKLRLYHRFGQLATAIKTMGPDGATFADVFPGALPTDFSFLLDVSAETDEAQAADVLKAEKFFTAMMTSQIPADHQKLIEWYGKKLGVKRPEQFRQDLPDGGQNVEEAPPGQASQPGDGNSIPFNNGTGNAQPAAAPTTPQQIQGTA